MSKKNIKNIKKSNTMKTIKMTRKRKVKRKGVKRTKTSISKGSFFLKIYNIFILKKPQKLTFIYTVHLVENK